MKKKNLGFVVIVAAVLMAGWNLKQSNSDIKLSDLTLSNVEALAQDEYSQAIWNVYSTSTGHSCTRGGSEKCTN